MSFEASWTRSHAHECQNVVLFRLAPDGRASVLAAALRTRAAAVHRICCLYSSGVRPMADKTSFTKDEWTLLLASPMIAGMAITAAEPSGLWGLLKESFAGGAALTQAVTGSDTNALVKSVVTDFSSGEGRSAARDGLKAKFANSKPAEMKGKCIDALRQVSALLAAKAPGDAAEFKNWLRQISQSTAEAASEGGGLFSAGVKVSDAEKATLGEISTALGV
jgi:hypothetical protein